MPQTNAPDKKRPDSAEAKRRPRALVAPAAVIRTSLSRSTKDGIAWSLMEGVGGRYVAPFVILGGSGLLGIAAVTGLPFLAGALVQWLAANLTDALGCRRRLLVTSGLTQAATWVPICVAIFLPLHIGYWLMLVAYIVYVGMHSFGQPAWQSIMGDLVPARRRGKYFGMRSGLGGGVLTASFFAAGWWLTFCENTEALALFGLESRKFGFLVMFVIAGLARLVSSWYLSRIHEPEYHRQPTDRFSIGQFVRRIPRGPFGRFTLYSLLLQMSFGFLTPFLSWYLLDQLAFTPGVFAAILGTGMVVSVSMQPVWGRLADRLGARRVLGIGGMGLVAAALLLLLCEASWQFLAVQALHGMMLSAYASGATNFFFETVSAPKRARCAAYRSLFVGTGMAAGCFLGALTALGGRAVFDALAIDGLHPFHLLAIGAAVIRLSANVLLLRSLGTPAGDDRLAAVPSPT